LKAVRRWLKRSLWLVACGCAGGARLASGAFYSDTLLAGGDEALLVPPVAQFRAELERIKRPRPVFPALLAERSPEQLTADMDVTDLAIAFRRSGLEEAKAKSIRDEYAAVRAKISAQAEPEGAPWGWQRPLFVPPALPEGLPLEFEDYLRGALAWHAGRTNDARRAWQQLLERPAAQRPFRSTWAAFMLGRSYAQQDDGLAIRYYRRVRELAKAGFADSLRLAASSIGWEAQVEYRRGRYEQAVELYLQQLASEDPSAVISLRWVAANALRGRVRSLGTLAGHAASQQLVTAYVIAGGFNMGPVDVDGPVRELAAKLLTRASFVQAPSNGWHITENPAIRWVKALDAAGTRDAGSAERLALAAYQCGQFEIAQRWLPVCRAQPVARWLQAKLCLREGRISDAAGLLGQLAHEFPVESAENAGLNRLRPAGRLDELWTEVYGNPLVNSRYQLLGELGALQLSRKRYVESLDCLLRGGFWADAAYVAERVLRVEELKQFVDQRAAAWRSEPPLPLDQESQMAQLLPRQQARIRWDKLRYLLGRRLTRGERGEEATLYYPVGLQAAHRRYLANLKEAEEPSRLPAERAAILWAAAQATREEGLELLGTEVEPDWAIQDGRFEGVSVLARAAMNAFVRPTWDELKRGQEHAPSPPERFHYRYRAAALAWEAAKLMPDNSDETARMLWRAGSWLKNSDAKAADVFYKALVRRCRKTPLGQAADRKRWFPAVEPSAPAPLPSGGRGAG
jgi:hypothetical protein